MNKILFIILAIIQISITSQDFNGFALYNSQNQNT